MEHAIFAVQSYKIIPKILLFYSFLYNFKVKSTNNECQLHNFRKFAASKQNIHYMYYTKPIVALALVAAASSCIKDEPLNTECDILTAEMPGIELVDAPVITNTGVEFTVRYDQPGPEFAPVFTVTEGATINPASGTERDFTDPQVYTVTSQDGKWTKDYTVRVKRQTRPEDPEVSVTYGFEDVYTQTTIGRTYDVFFEENAAGEEEWAWASANSAFALTLQGKVPEDFPTYQADGGVEGKCAVLVTRATGSFGASVNKPMAAGNLFTGNFDVTNALAKPLEATHFGRGHIMSMVPISFSGFYKFKAGETYCELGDNGKLVPVPEKTDMFNLYAVLFEATADMQWLNGENVLSESNPNIISWALIPDRHESDEWVEFSVPFVYRPGKSIDKQKMQDGRYRLAIVMSSSENGDYFSGAIGSTLHVDELTIVCKREKTEEE